MASRGVILIPPEPVCKCIRMYISLGKWYIALIRFLKEYVTPKLLSIIVWCPYMSSDSNLTLDTGHGNYDDHSIYNALHITYVTNYLHRLSMKSLYLSWAKSYISIF